MKEGRTWVVFELTSVGEKCAKEGTLETFLRSNFKSAEVFIPYVSFTHLNRSALLNVMEGYFFVEYCLEDSRYTSLVGNAYVKSVLHTGSERAITLLTVPELKVVELQDRLSSMIAAELQEGMLVKVDRGALKGLSGRILSFSGDYAQIIIELRTLKAIRTVPRFALCPQEDADG